MRKLKNVTILGAGTAGWISAYILSDFFFTNKQNVKVTIVDPSSIPIIGVGEGTTGIAKIITDLNIFPNASSITNWSKTLSGYKKNIYNQGS